MSRRSNAQRLAVLSLALSPALAQAAPAGYKLVWGDEFAGTTLDTMKWGYNYSWGNTHNHAAYMDASQVKISNGVLNLQAIKQRHPNAVDKNADNFGWQVMDYTSGAINSSGKFSMSSGYVEARMKMPSQLGSWPAFWMLKSGWPPEIDIMEYPRGTNNSATQYWANYHYTNNSNAHASYGWQDNKGVDLSAAYHTYGVEWTATAMKFYFDGNVTHTITDAAAIADAQSMYLILNHAVGGWAGTPTGTYPADFLTDYVRVYQTPAAAANFNWAGTAATGSWDTAGNWSSAVVPKFQDQAASFGTNANASVAVNWNGIRALGSLTLDGTTAYTIGNSSGSLLMNSSSGTASILMGFTATAPQTIASRLEANTDLNITNNSAQTLALTGVIIGGGAVRFKGAGTTLISNNNTYAGDTFIDYGTAGAAVVRVDRSRPFGTGTVYFNPTGNGTTGRIEILGGREVPNAIILSGRNNTAAAIQNISDNNKFSGTISLQTGGGSYILQSDAGQLELSGSDPAAGGVAVQAGATGSRNFTLQGVGNGLVSGKIVNGNGVVGLTKLGTGTWTFSAANTYTGPTTVSAGTLALADGGTFGTAAVTNNANVAFTNAGAMTFGGTINGTGTVAKTGAGVVTVTGANNYTGGTTLAGGTLALVGGATLGTGPVANAAALSFVNATDLTVANVITGSGTVTQTTAATTTLTGASTYSGVTTVNAGTLRATADSYANLLTNAGGVNIRAGKFVLDYTGGTSPAAQVKAILAEGFAAGGNFLNGQIRTSNGTFLRGLGYADSGTAVTVYFTVNGDATADGVVNFNDFLTLQTNFGQSDVSYAQGDFNFDNVVDFNDFLTLQSNFGYSTTGLDYVGFSSEQVAAITAFGIANAVPEPAGLAALGALGAMMLRRKRV